MTREELQTRYKEILKAGTKDNLQTTALLLIELEKDILLYCDQMEDDFYDEVNETVRQIIRKMMSEELF